MHNICLKLEFPILNDSFMYFSEIKELNAESQCPAHGCLVRGIFGAIFMPLKKTSYVINGICFKIGVKRKDQRNHILLSTDLFTRIKLDDLQLVDINLRVPELSLFFSPVDVSMYLAVGKISSNEYKHTRNGRQLWKLAASKVSHVTSAPRLSLHKLVVVVSLWLRYVNAYEHILSLIGYPAEHRLQSYCAEMRKSNMCLSPISFHWKVISDIEKELPAEAIAQARRIARYRAASRDQQVRDTDKESVADSHFKFISNILYLLSFILKLVCNMFHMIVTLLCSRKFLVHDPKNDGDCGAVSNDPHAHSYFSLNLGKILIVVCQMKEIQPSANEKLESHIGISHSELLSFCLSIDDLLLAYVQSTCEQSAFLSCGELKINSSSSMGDFAREINTNNYSGSVKGPRMARVNNLKSILWCEPAQMFLLPESSETGASGDAEATCAQILENFLGEMWLSWGRACMKFGECHIKYSENPVLLCEIKSSLTYPGDRKTESGFWKCSLILGKLNLALGYSSMLSICLLLRQMQDALSWTEDHGRAKVLSDPPRSIDDQPETNKDSKYKYNCSGAKTAFLRVLPEKHIQLGIFIAGAHIHMPMRKDFDGLNMDVNYKVDQDDFCLAFDVHNIDIAVWPTSRCDLASLNEAQGSDYAEKICLLLKEPRMTDLQISENEKYVSQGCISLCSYLRANGFDAYVEGSAEKQHSQIFALKPLIVQLSSQRWNFGIRSCFIFDCCCSDELGKALCFMSSL